MSFSPERLRAALESIEDAAGIAPAGHCIALSGGLDSTALLVALAARPPHRGGALRALHVDHQLHPDAARWSTHSVALAARFGVPCEIVQVDARPGAGESPEAVARQARYRAFGARLRPGEVLLTAHHGDDQLETVLLQWLRGGGLRAVAGMRPAVPFAAGWLVRPMLGFTRAALRVWAESESLAWLEDPSNADSRFDRNYLRLQVLPALRARWPAAARTIGRVATQAAEALDLEAELVLDDLRLVTAGETLELAALARLSPARQRVALRAWLRARGCAPPALATLEALRRDMSVAAADRNPVVSWPGGIVRRYRGRLYARQPPVEHASWRRARWAPGTTFDLGDWGRLELLPDTGTGLSRARVGSDLEVAPRPSAAAFRPAGSAHQRELRKWLQERGVLPWCRDALPCVKSGGEIVAVGDLAYGGACAAAPGEPAWRIAWHGRPRLTEAEAIAAGDDA